MPFDGTNFTRAKPDVFSVEGLRDWLRTQDPSVTYDYEDAKTCLVARWTGKILFSHQIPLPIRYIANEVPQTFGAALSRCDAYLARTGA